MTEKVQVVHPITGEAQKCFLDGIFMVCNFVVKSWGIQYKTDGGWLKFPTKKGRQVRRRKPHVVLKQLNTKETPSQKVSLLYSNH